VKAGHLIIAYHGCDVTVRDDLVSRRLAHLDHSKNRYDWLGPGAYFFEDDYYRAFMFATASFENPDKRYTARPIATPAVVGAVLRVQHWLDMTSQEGLREFAKGYAGMCEYFEQIEKTIPTNAPANDEDEVILLRQLDNAVFTYMHDVQPGFQAVRGAFHQGEEIAPRSGFHKQTHIQLALRDNSCVVGWFLPEGAELLTEEKYDEAKQRLNAAKLKHKKLKVRAK
jgi:hypothetical protein